MREVYDQIMAILPGLLPCAAESTGTAPAEVAIPEKRDTWIAAVSFFGDFICFHKDTDTDIIDYIHIYIYTHIH
jgi:hypothetical protein